MESDKPFSYSAPVSSVQTRISNEIYKPKLLPTNVSSKYQSKNGEEKQLG